MWFSAANRTCAAVIVPSAPTTLQGSVISSTEIDLTWVAGVGGSNAANFKLYRNGTPIVITAGLTFNDTGLSASTQYTYQVSAIDNAGNEGPKGASIQATTQSGGGGGSNSPVINWDASTPTPTFYFVYRAATTGALSSAAVLVVVTGDQTTWTDPTPPVGQTYYAVTAVNSGGAESAQSAPIPRIF